LRKIGTGAREQDKGKSARLASKLSHSLQR